MREAHRLRLLEIDSVVNLLLGVALLGMPEATIAFFGLPATDELFYASVLGAVLFGIGVALWAERKNDDNVQSPSDSKAKDESKAPEDAKKEDAVV